MNDKGSYEYPAWCQMETALDSYEQDRAAYLVNEANKLGADGRARLERFTGAADSLLEGVQELMGVDGISTLKELAGMSEFQRSKHFELLHEHICIKFGWESLKMLSVSRSRFLDLMLLLKDRRPCYRSRAFLKRVARCYLFGFDGECVILCRSVLDREFDDAVIGDDQLSEWWKWYVTTPQGIRSKDKRPPYGVLWARIAAAEFAGLISPEDRNEADSVRDRGNDAVHKKPDSGDAWEAIRQTVQVVDALEKSRV